MNRKKLLADGAVGLGAGLLNGLFGAGGGLVVVPALKKFGGLNTKTAHATSVAVIAALSLVSSVFYLRKGMVTIQDAAPYFVGGTIGGFLGGQLLKKISGNLISRIFGAFMIYAALRMLLWG